MNLINSKVRPYIVILSLVILIGHSVDGQNEIFNYKPHGSNTAFDPDVDCVVKNQKLQDETKIVQFQPMPFFLHTSPEFEKWSKGKYLLETKASLYKAADQTFLLLNFVFNTINAKKTYGAINKGARFRFYLENGESLYLENIEKNKGIISREYDTSDYTAVLILKKQEKKLLEKFSVLKLGVEWQNGYQEYTVHNHELIMNQIDCLNEY